MWLGRFAPAIHKVEQARRRIVQLVPDLVGVHLHRLLVAAIARLSLQQEQVSEEDRVVGRRLAEFWTEKVKRGIGGGSRAREVLRITGDSIEQDAGADHCA